MFGGTKLLLALDLPLIGASFVIWPGAAFIPTVKQKVLLLFNSHLENLNSNVVVKAVSCVFLGHKCTPGIHSACCKLSVDHFVLLVVSSANCNTSVGPFL